MRLFADLHIHSRFSKACSQDLNLQNLERWALIKGLHILGTGDFTHPTWLNELKQNLQQVTDDGIFSYGKINFILTTEISNVYELDGKIKKIHHILLVPSFEVAEQINDYLSKFTNLSVDGRPTVRIASPKLVEDIKSISSKIEIIPAHAWTPHFALFGSKSGFDSLKECYEDKANEIHAIESGMSSDPAMNWRLSALDKIQIVSFSDAHSYWPWRIGREATIFDTELKYNKIINAIRTGEGLAGTIETSPEYGKYHFDGHRNCGVWMEPQQSKKYNNRCPKCGKPLTIGVLNRVEQLADRPANYKPEKRPPFYTLLPLAELLAASLGTKSVTAKPVLQIYNEMLERFSSEYAILMEAPPEQLSEIVTDDIVELIIKNRFGKLTVQPGYDGVYGKLLLEKNASNKMQQMASEQKSLFDYN
ncbi:MAG: endonuclease Q family protein [Candidatus Nanoarchaeia archaeon]